MLTLTRIRPITEADWPAIQALQAETYYALEPESEAVLRSKQRLGPESCLVATSGDTLLGYCLAHPWRKQTPASLYHCYSQPSGHETLYIHDMVVSAKARGRGIARAFLRHLEQLARDKAQQEMSLVAVQGADGYWARVGFKPRAPGKSLAQYGEDAVYMWRPLESQRSHNENTNN